MNEKLNLDPAEQVTVLDERPVSTARSGFFNWPRITAVAIPAYAYFLGYSSFKYRLEHVGFASPNTSAAAGEVYYQAMHAFAFIAMKVLPAIPDILKRGFMNSIPAMAASVVLGIAAYVLQRRLAKKRMSPAQEEKTPRDEDSHRTHIMNSLGVAAATNGIALLSVPAILALIILIAFIILPPPILGMYMGANDLKEFNCPESAQDVKVPMRCTILHLSDKTSLVGQIFYRDDEFTYVLTKSKALSVPNDQIKGREHFVTTGTKDEAKN